jgi:hypothetical protein
LTKVALIPVLDIGSDDSRTLFKDGTKIEKIICCKLLDAQGVETKDYFIANEALIPGVYQRTIYEKGPSESTKLGTLFIDLKAGVYTLRLSNPLHRPAGLDLHVTVQPTEESKCQNCPSAECQSMKAAA